ncbi:MAG: hypothetical protein JW944_06725 [Deltaproteobacteria bacterium]|nr:hypothetical protein [Deltaproteobacteria bacterium]
MKKILRISQTAAIFALLFCVIALAADGPSVPGSQSGMPGGPGGMPGGPPMQNNKSIVDITGQNVKVDDAYFKGKSSATEISDFTISSDNEGVVGVNINAQEGADKIIVRNGRISLIEKGTAISIAGNSNTLIDGVVVWNKGNADGLSAAGDTNTHVKNTVIYGAQDPKTYRRVSPFALGLAGSMRVTNAVQNAKITYEDSIVVSGSWAALSTDAGSGVCLKADNVLAGIGTLEVAEKGKKYTATRTVNNVTYGFTLGDSANYNSGYISYCDTGFHNYYNNCRFYGTDYDLILSTSNGSATVTGRDTCFYSDRIGVMWHKNAGGTVDITDGSWYAKQCMFMMKGYSSTDTDGCWPNLIVDKTDLEVGPGGVLLQLMTSDDCGLNFEALQVPAVESDWSKVKCLLGTKVQKTYSEGFPPTMNYVFLSDGKEVGVSADKLDEWVKANPDAKPVMVDYEPQKTATSVFKNLKVEGDIYNSVWEAYQAVDLTFENASVTGVISSSFANHVDAKGQPLEGGTVIKADSSLDCHLGMGRLKNTVAPTVNNPVYLTLSHGSTWIITNTSYISRLVIDDSSSVKAEEGAVTMTVNGVATPIKAGTYEGKIIITTKS